LLLVSLCRDHPQAVPPCETAGSLSRGLVDFATQLLTGAGRIDRVLGFLDALVNFLASLLGRPFGLAPGQGCDHSEQECDEGRSRTPRFRSHSDLSSKMPGGTVRHAAHGASQQDSSAATKDDPRRPLAQLRPSPM